MSDIAIRVENLSKAYRIGLKEQQHETMLGAMAAWVKSPLKNFRDLRNLSRFDDVSTDNKKQKAESEPTKTEIGKTENRNEFQLSTFNSQLSSPSDVFWALKDVSFEVKHGEAIGIIGRNGAGKSTLLKILSRITEPTSGRAMISGRVASLLEVGTGFHPDLTGRENVYLNGTILGMKKREVDAKFDEIVDFSGVEKFIDTPVKRYSSGMRVRLAFSVAAHLEPEVLIIDEVLAVGDAAFQKKCLGKLNDVTTAGRTILFVSHNMVALKSLCERGVLLREGQLIADGEMAGVVDAYLETDASEVISQEWPIAATSPGTDSFRFNWVRLRSGDEPPDGHLTVRSAFEVDISLRAARIGRINLTLHLYLLTGELVFAVASPTVDVTPGNVSLKCQFPANLLNDALYTLSVMIVEDSRSHFVLTDALRFEVHDCARTGAWLGKWPGFVRPHLEWDYQHLADDAKS